MQILVNNIANTLSGIILCAHDIYVNINKTFGKH